MELTEEQADRLSLALERGIYPIADNSFGWWVQEAFTKNKEPDVDIARRVLKGIEDGDPLVLDYLPCIDWSGQWADGPDWDVTFMGAWWTVFHKDLEEDYDDDRDILDIDAISDCLYQELGDGNLIGMCEVHCRNILEEE